MKTFVLQRARDEKPAHAPDLSAALNPQQLAAVTHPGGPALVVAGAGTGKTRVLTYRVAHLVGRGIDPRRILLLTFTRRAAQQMLRRASALVGPSCDGVEGGTFHAFAHRILRRYGALIGYAPSFTVLDEADAADTLDLLRAAYVGQGRRFPRKETVRGIYSHAVNRGLDIEASIRERAPQFMEHAAALTQLHGEWMEFKRGHNLMDFDDLLLNLRQLLEEQPGARRELAQRFTHVLVDEYQDTNRLQGDLVHLLAGEGGDLLAVGDEAQSIYGFRGSDVRNILDFPQRFTGARVYRLEHNYRSTQPILAVANAIMEEAEESFGKVLFTDRPGGETPLLVACPDPEAQAQFIAQQILADRDRGISLSDQAVLFRSARQSAELELELTRRGIPFQKFGGQRFFDTAHVKDVLAYLKVFHNPSDLVSWHRLLKLVPGVGSRTAATLAEAVQARGDASLVAEVPAPPKAREPLRQLASLFVDLSSAALSTADRIQAVVDFYQPTLEGRYDDHPRRRKDLDQLVAVSEGFDGLPALLTDLALDPPQSAPEREDLDDEDEILTLSTIHSAKGLEWSHVYVMWVADGYLPSAFSQGDAEAVEEERRLLYVAVTRARAQLLLCYPMTVNDRSRGYIPTTPSRFVDRIQESVLEPARLTLSS